MDSKSKNVIKKSEKLKDMFFDWIDIAQTQTNASKLYEDNESAHRGIIREWTALYLYLAYDLNFYSVRRYKVESKKDTAKFEEFYEQAKSDPVEMWGNIVACYYRDGNILDQLNVAPRPKNKTDAYLMKVVGGDFLRVDGLDDVIEVKVNEASAITLINENLEFTQQVLNEKLNTHKEIRLIKVAHILSDCYQYARLK